MLSTQGIKNQSTLTTGTTAAVDFVSIATSASSASRLYVRPNPNISSRRIAIDLEGSSTAEVFLDEFYRVNHAFAPTLSRLGYHSYDAGLNALLLKDNSGNVLRNEDFDDGSVTYGDSVTDSLTPQGNAFQMRSSWGTASITVAGSTTLPRASSPNQVDNVWLYRINATAGNATVNLEATDVTAFINGRLRRVCKVDKSANTVTVQAQGGGNPVVLSYINECVDYYNLPGGGSNQGIWHPIGILTSTSTPVGSSSGGGYNIEPATVTVRMNQGGTATTMLVTSTFTVSGSTVLVNGTTYYWPTSCSGTNKLFSINDGVITCSDAITDAARQNEANTFTELNVYQDTSTFNGYVEASTVVVVNSLEIPNGAAPTVNETGEIALDTTDKALIAYDGTEAFVVAHATKDFSVTISTPPGGWSGATIPIWSAPPEMAVTIRSIRATAQDGTSITFNLEERAFGSMGSAGTDIMAADLAADTDGETQVVFSNASIAAGAHLTFTCSSVSGSPNYIHIQVLYSETVE